MLNSTYFISTGHKLQGTLTFPDGINKPPARLFIGVSFHQNRDHNLEHLKIDWFPVPLAQCNLFRDEAYLLQQIGIVLFGMIKSVVTKVK